MVPTNRCLRIRNHIPRAIGDDWTGTGKLRTNFMNKRRFTLQGKKGQNGIIGNNDSPDCNRGVSAGIHREIANLVGAQGRGVHDIPRLIN